MLHLPTLRYDNWYFWFVVWTGRNIFYLPHHQQSIYNSSKHNMFTIQEIALGTCNEELAPVCVFTAICLKNKIFQLKLKLFLHVSRQEELQDKTSFRHYYLQNNHPVQNPLFMCHNSYGYLPFMPIMFRIWSFKFLFHRQL